MCCVYAYYIRFGCCDSARGDNKEWAVRFSFSKLRLVCSYSWCHGSSGHIVDNVDIFTTSLRVDKVRAYLDIDISRTSAAREVLPFLFGRVAQLIFRADARANEAKDTYSMQWRTDRLHRFLGWRFAHDFVFLLRTASNCP